jgi:hypothetical protein
MTAPTLVLDSWFAEPGGAFAGRVRMAPSPEAANGRVRGVRLELRRHTEGRGDQDQWDGPPQLFALAPDGSLYQPFVLRVPPDAPISYDGNLFRLIWTIRAVLDVRLRGDPRTELAVVVAPFGGLALYARHRRPHPLTSSAPGPPR